MITLQKIVLRRSQKVLLEDINLTLYAKQKIGLIGDNGCGKSSFFAMITGELEPHQGMVTLPNNLEIAQVKQEIPTTSRAAIEYVIDGDRRYRALETILDKAIEEGDAHSLAKCHDELASTDGYAIIGKAEKILRGLGFHSHQLQQPTKDFSGGWRMRLNLAQALMGRADLMLLDEPTNHLDLDAIIWLEKWLQDYAGTLLIISHDREFLDNTVSHILHFEDKQLRLYRGDYSSFEKQRAQQLAIQQSTYEKQSAQIAHMQAFIDRFKAKASKAKQAQSRMKALGKIELVAAVQTRASLQFNFKIPKECPNPLLRIEKAVIGYNLDTPVLTGVDIQIAPSDRIGLLGVNGAGKSTFIKILAGILQPLSGLVHFYKGIKIGYFAQHQIEHLDLQLSPVKLLQNTATNTSEQALRSFLGSFNFSGEMATSPVENFSGGEKARLALALIVWQAPNLLLLDEPTNHLDMNMREALILALQEYTGALILVSHDRHLVRTTTDELILVADKKISRFRGDLEDYRDSLLQKKTNPDPATQKKSPKVNRQLEVELKALEKELSQLQKQKSKLDKMLADPAFYEKEDPAIVKRVTQEQEQLCQKISKIEERWLVLSEG
ncbi:MAG: ATP-binding cassette domain-containing protein [Gammaproteobacteria bacterium]|nr:ATP-binding cassette domain-containing protein [Gammaproteobacteria bacterium]